ncbi:hypothetical protein P7F88_10250 [Vibrio hannami]|uniref:hypothetical protein n=1 Tax=Vibrio hannami TaxID=2717094 RepID=UPI0024105931|nr:hypothetical protein [Vibrio hannami]MDG3086471.1 hypothetical protein [Vibrio hannami]
MKKLAIALVIATSSIWSAATQASVMLPIKHTIQYFITDSNFNMSEFEEFTTENGETFNIHASMDEPNRVLVMDTSWSPLPELTSSMSEKKGRTAGLEYAKSQGVEVKLTDADYHYHNGAYGYSFTVNAVSTN